MITPLGLRRTSIVALMGAVAVTGATVPAAGASRTARAATPPAACVTRTAAVTPATNFTAGDVTLSRGSVAVSGLNTVPVTVTARAGWTSAPRADHGSTCILVSLSRTSATSPTDQQPWPERHVVLHLVSGTPRNGVYSGTTLIPSTLGGTLKATRVSAEPRLGDEYGLPATVTVDGPVLAVRGVHVPRIVSLASRSAGKVGGVRQITVSGKVVDTATGRGYTTGVRVSVCSGDMGSYRRVLRATTAVRSTGRFAATVPDAGFGACAALEPATPTTDAEGFQRIAVAVGR